MLLPHVLQMHRLKDGDEVSVIGPHTLQRSASSGAHRQARDGMGASRGDLDRSSRGRSDKLAQQRSSHNRPRRIAGAKKQHGELIAGVSGFASGFRRHNCP